MSNKELVENNMQDREFKKVFSDIKYEILNAQYDIFKGANARTLSLYYTIGKIIEDNAKWGNKFVETLSKDLRMTYPGREGYSVRNLNYMKQFARRIPSEKILHQGGAKLMELIFCGKGIYRRY